MADYAADAAALLDAVGWDRCRVVGVSFGGMVAQELAVTCARAGRAAGAVCTSPGGAGGASYPLHELAWLLDAGARPTSVRQLLDTRFTPEWLAAHPGDRGLAEMMAARRAEPTKAPRQLRGETRAARARAPPRRVRPARPRSRARRSSRAAATTASRPSANGEAIAARVPDAELRFYEGGHAFFAQDPTALPEILDFLAGEPGPAASS